ncbi:LIC11213 family lipoprotein [Leptospira idonii]|uniref:Cytochrome C Planctomycete-type domain-containing protein n=1 Tax=Leptospira idonii TaxID=1193500 RepID=A0A4R9M189_9LEPT|nr:hypothetical protein [Leptospira idonii]TGN18498.1 hypothetical protein EHS15_13995 [Leptospira idonii]
MKPLSLIFRLFLVLSFTGCSYEKASEKDKDTALGALLLSRLASSSSSTASGAAGKFPIPSCETPSPAFSSLATAGFNSTCGTSGCHNGSVRYDTTSYSQVKGYTNPGSPTTSILYKEQSTGAMAIHTNQAIDKAIYCWILGGSSP